MRALVTGAAGFIGSHLCEELLARGHHVRGLALDDIESKILLDLGVEAVQGDVRNPDSLRTAVTGIGTIFHLAGRVNVAGSWRLFKETNVEGTANMLRAAVGAKVNRFIHFSSVAVYDSRYIRTHHDITEDAPHDGKGDRPFGHYARSKVLAEQLVSKYQAENNLPATILRPAWVYGPRDQTIMPYLLEYLECPKAYWIGKLDPPVSLIYVKDVARCAIAAAESNRAVGQAYNVAPVEAVNLRTFISELCKALDLKVPVKHVPYRVAWSVALLGELWMKLTRKTEPVGLNRAVLVTATSERYYDPSKAVNELNWTPEISLAEGIHLTADFYKAPPNRI